MFCLDLWSVSVLYLAAGSRKSPILFSFQVLSPLLSFSPHVVSFFLSLLFTTGIQVFGPRDAAGGAERCKVHFCPPVRACVGLWGGRQPKALGQFHCPAAFRSKSYGKKGVWQGVGWIRVGLGFECDCRLPPLFSCLVPFCPASRGAAGQTNAPA